jgi:hypothetical protein
MTDAKKYDLSGQHGAEAFRTLPEGTRLTLLNGATGEITANAGDGGYVLVKFLSYPQDPSKVGEEEYVFFNEVREAES